MCKHVLKMLSIVLVSLKTNSQMGHISDRPPIVFLETLWFIWHPPPPNSSICQRRVELNSTTKSLEHPVKQ